MSHRPLNACCLRFLAIPMLGAAVALSGCSASVSPEMNVDYSPPQAPSEGLLLLVRPAAGAAHAASGVLEADGATLAPRDTRIRATVYGPVAEVRVKQKFKNDSDRTLDATYRLPVPLDAAVMDFTCTIGGRNFRAMVVDAALAEKVYAAAIQQGKHAALVKPDAAGWKLRLGRVRAGEEVGTEVKYAQALSSIWKGALAYGDDRGETGGGPPADVLRDLPPIPPPESMLVEIGFPLPSAGELSWDMEIQLGQTQHVDLLHRHVEDAACLSTDHWNKTVRWNPPYLWCLRHGAYWYQVEHGSFWGPAGVIHRFDGELAPTGELLPAAAAPALSALWARQEIERLAALDAASGKPEHAKDILALARKHHVATASTPLMLVDAK